MKLEALGIPLCPTTSWFGLCISLSSQKKEKMLFERFGFPFFFFFFYNFKYSTEYKLILHLKKKSNKKIKIK